MAHPAQKEFFRKVKQLYPDNFHQAKVLDCGSLNINGSAKDLFTQSEYTGVDIVAGKDVDIVSFIKDLEFENSSFDTVISGEMLEHDGTWKESLKKMYDLCKQKGLIVISCAGEGRPEHGTSRTNGKQWGTAHDYYMNLTEQNFREVYKDDMFDVVYYEYNPVAHDQYFYGIKK